MNYRNGIRGLFGVLFCCFLGTGLGDETDLSPILDIPGLKTHLENHRGERNDELNDLIQKYRTALEGAINRAATEGKVKVAEALQGEADALAELQKKNKGDAPDLLRESRDLAVLPGLAESSPEELFRLRSIWDAQQKAVDGKYRSKLAQLIENYVIMSTKNRDFVTAKLLSKYQESIENSGASEKKSGGERADTIKEDGYVVIFPANAENIASPEKAGNARYVEKFHCIESDQSKGRLLLTFQDKRLGDFQNPMEECLLAMKVATEGPASTDDLIQVRHSSRSIATRKGALEGENLRFELPLRILERKRGEWKLEVTCGPNAVLIVDEGAIRPRLLIKFRK